MVRLFVALELDRFQKSTLDLVRGGVESARWQRDNQLHLTLAFIGDVATSKLDDIDLALSGIRFDPFDLALFGVGSFGKPGRPKSLWAGVQDAGPVAHLHSKILWALERVGIATDRRRYKPHVTIARFPRHHIKARTADWLTNHATLKTPASTVSHFTLFSSGLSHDGAHYFSEARYGQMGRLDAEFCDQDIDEIYDGLPDSSAFQWHGSQNV